MTTYGESLLPPGESVVVSAEVPNYSADRPTRAELDECTPEDYRSGRTSVAMALSSAL